MIEVRFGAVTIRSANLKEHEKAFVNLVLTMDHLSDVLHVSFLHVIKLIVIAGVRIRRLSDNQLTHLVYEQTLRPRQEANGCCRKHSLSMCELDQV